MTRVTLKDVAHRAGVSISTVSYALKEPGTTALAPATRSRIRDLAGQMGYVPNGLARSLQSRSSTTVGVLLDKPLTVPRYAEIVQGLADGLAGRGYQLSLLEGGSIDACVDAVRAGRLEGLVFIGHDDRGVPGTLARAVTAHGIPLVALDCGDPASAPWSSVDFDYGAGATRLVEHLADRGMTRIVHVRPDIASRAERQRERAIAVATVALGLDHVAVSTGMTEQRLAAVESDPELSYAVEVCAGLDTAAPSIIEGRADAATTALVCSWGTDVEAVHRWAGRRDPEIRVASLAGGSPDPHLWPGLTYSRLPLRHAGELAAGLIVDLSRTPGAPTRVILTPTLEPEHTEGAASPEQTKYSEHPEPAAFTASPAPIEKETR